MICCCRRPMFFEYHSGWPWWPALLPAEHTSMLHRKSHEHWGSHGETGFLDLFGVCFAVC